jgi:hypothetical protein
MSAAKAVPMKPQQANAGPLPPEPAIDANSPVHKLRALYLRKGIRITWQVRETRAESPLDLYGPGFHRFDGPRL